MASIPQQREAADDVWALVARAQAGDMDAFAGIYRRYVDTVNRFVYYRVHSRELAEDLTGETFLRALRRIGTVTDQGRDLGAWLITIARNLVADYFKSARFRFEITTADIIDENGTVAGPAHVDERSPEAVVIEYITNLSLLGALRELTADQQECVVLRFLRGFTLAETAHVMGKDVGAVKALQYRATNALRRELAGSLQ